MEKSIEVHQINSIDILKGKSLLELDGLVDDILKLKSYRLDDNPVNSQYEDTRCPETPLVQEIIKELVEAFKGATGHDLILLECWSHIHEKNMSTRLHDHYPTDVSAVYYVKVPKGAGSLVFHPQSNKYHVGSIPVEPEEKTFIFFPGHLDHSVSRNHSNETRISLSFNFKIQGNTNE